MTTLRSTTVLRIHNVRFGFATNSSSSHSILLLPSREDARLIGSNSPYDDGYGWENFTLTTPSEKSAYLAAQLGEALNYDSYKYDGVKEEHNAFVEAEIRRLMGDRFGEVSYVDHQSTWKFPGTWEDPLSPHPVFVADLLQFLENDRVIVLGGNDNSDGHPLIEDRVGGTANPMLENIWTYPFTEYGAAEVIARDDKTHWVLFDRSSGSKARVSFEAIKAPDKALTPELVDVKITDYCSFGCTFCYQDSTPKGKHASLEQIERVIAVLREAEVFEVAIGGGEPTLHPQFVEILKRFRAAGIVPNFTTRSLAWMKKPRITRQIMGDKDPGWTIPITGLAGAFAYSAHSPDDIDLLAEAVQDAEITTGTFRHRSVIVHIVMGTVGRHDLSSMLRRAKAHNFGVTLLGWKTTGRADANPDHPYLRWWLDVIKDEKVTWVGIDTALAAEAESAGQMDEFPKWMYHVADGNFSCYVDAVAETCAPSSWEPGRGSWPLADLVSAFQGEWGAA